MNHGRLAVNHVEHSLLGADLDASRAAHAARQIDQGGAHPRAMGSPLTGLPNAADRARHPLQLRAPQQDGAPGDA